MYSVPDVSGRVCMITGANSGIGKATAQQLAGGGAHVFVASRSKERSMPVVETFGEEAGHDRVEFLKLDLASLDSVCQCADTFLGRDLPLHVLINNAATVGSGITEDGFELNFGVNHLGHFLLTNLLLDHIRDSAPARIVTVLGYRVRDIHSGKIDFEAVQQPTQSYSRVPEYARSKVANALFGYELADRLDDTDVASYLAVPGPVATNIFEGFVPPVSWIGKVGKLFMRSPDQGAKTSLYCATSPEIGPESSIRYMDCEPTAPNPPIVEDKDHRRDLWDKSAKWTGLSS